MSPFGYNETLVNDYFPLEKEEAFASGFRRSDYESLIPQVEKIVEGNQISDDILMIGDEMLSTAIRCEVSGRPFLMIKPELDFYRKHNLPIPKKHPDVRYAERIALRNERKLHKENCSTCGKEMISSIAVHDGVKVLCEVCYDKTML
jgi:hypothetical protein